jgi:hypothetical protein
MLNSPDNDVREWAEQRYIVLRAQLDEQKALLEVMELAQAGEGPRVATKQAVGQWFLEDSWEKAYRASRSAALLASDQFRSDKILHDRMERLEDANEILRRIYTDAMRPKADPILFTKYRQQSNDVTHLEEAVKSAEGELARRFGEQVSLPRWRRRLHELEQSFLTQFFGKGPHYELLCHRLAAAEVRMSQLEELGVPVGHDEYSSLNRTIVDITAQLQRYTESSKVEMLDDERNVAMAKALELVESVIAPEAPELWARAVQLVIAAAKGEDTSPRQKVLEAPRNGRG